MPIPRFAVAPEVRIASSQPATPATAPASTKLIRIRRSTLMPARKVAMGLPPIIVMCRPNGVLRIRTEKPIKLRIATKALGGSGKKS